MPNLSIFDLKVLGGKPKALAALCLPEIFQSSAANVWPIMALNLARPCELIPEIFLLIFY
jgi:hypothetical protein